MRPKVMGVVNVTPDSFSDGGHHDTVDAAVAHGLQLLEEGADLLDVGGESTRPGAVPVDEATELARPIPVIEGLRAARPDVVISVDTSKPMVAASPTIGCSASLDHFCAKTTDVWLPTRSTRPSRSMISRLARAVAAPCMKSWPSRGLA